MEIYKSAKFCRNCGYSFDDLAESDDVDSKSAELETVKSTDDVNDMPNTTRNLIIIAVVAILSIAAVVGSIFYLNSDGDFNFFAQEEPMHIINTTFTTGHSLDAKSICTINVGSNHSGENVSVNVLYSRDGNNLNDGDKSTQTVDVNGDIICESEESYKLYPDHAVVTIYDGEGNILDSVDVKLSTDDSTQLAIGNGTVSASSITTAEHSA